MLEQRAYEQEEELGGLRKRLKLPPLSGKLMAPPVSGNADLTRKKVESVRYDDCVTWFSPRHPSGAPGK